MVHLYKTPDFIFSTNKIGTVNISTNLSGVTFTDRYGSPLAMPYEETIG